MLKSILTRFWIIFVSAFLENFQPIGCHFNFYVDARESRILYRLDAREIFFIRNGVINQNAVILLNEDIPPLVNRMVFHWRLFESGRNTSYHLKIIHSPGPIMNPPVLNISSNGFVPSKEEAFSIDLPCTGRVRDHVDVYIKMTFISKFPNENEPLDLNFKRRKFCEKRSTVYMDGGSEESSHDLVLPIPKLSPFASSAIAFGSASTSIVLLLFLIGLIYATRKKRHPSTTPSSLVHLDYMPHHNLPSDEDKSFQSQESLARYCSVHPPRDSGQEVSFLNSCSKSLSLHFRNGGGSDSGRQLLQNYSSSLSSASNPDPATIYRYLPSRLGEENSSSKGPRSLIIEDGILKLSSCGYPPPPPAPPPSRIPNISSGSSLSSLVPKQQQQTHQSQQQPMSSLLSSSLTNSSSNEYFFPNGESLGILTPQLDGGEQQPGIGGDDSRDDDDVNYLPHHLYPHLMPKNIKQATEPSKTILI